MFGAGHVRRMVMGKNEKENEWKVGVLSPRVQGVVSHGKSMSMNGGRRTTMSGMDVRSNPSTADREGVRLSFITQSQGYSASRGSLMTGGKAVWR